MTSFSRFHISRKSMVALFGAALVILTLTIYLQIKLNQYLRLPPIPQLLFKSAEGWAFRGGCQPILVASANQTKESFRCTLKLKNSTYFETRGEISKVADWCNQEALSIMQNQWDINWRFLQIEYSRHVPPWWESCRKEVLIETGFHFQFMPR
jgi:hypothetical protein